MIVDDGETAYDTTSLSMTVLSKLVDARMVREIIGVFIHRTWQTFRGETLNRNKGTKISSEK